MAQCPFCRKEIDYLHVTVVEEYIKSYASTSYDEVDQIQATMSRWRCPECNHLLAIEDEAEADSFLAGSDCTSQSDPDARTISIVEGKECPQKKKRSKR
jgi:transposase-like protein